MIKVDFDYHELNNYALALGARADQIPYALSLALNKAADVTRQYLIKTTWPTHVVQRNASFIAASLTTKQARASKSSLSTEIYDRLGRGNLKMQALGGTRTPRGGGNLAVPVSTMKRTARGVPQRFKPRNLRVAVKKNGLLFTRDGKGRLKLLYSLKPATKIPKRVPFYDDFANIMGTELKRNIPLALKKAMMTAR